MTGRAPGALTTIRDDGRLRRTLTLGAAILGVVLASVHWSGLVVAGVLVGVLQRSLPRAVLAGLAVGALALVAFVLYTPRLEPGELLALRPVVFVAVGAGLGLPVLGSLARGVV